MVERNSMGRPLTKTKPEAITPEGRVLDLRKAGADFSTHLSTSPGMVLTPELRLGVAICARDALLSRRGASYREALAVCPFRLYGFVTGIEDKPAFPAPPTGGDWDPPSPEIAACLLNIVHAIVNFQSKLDTRWYDDAVSDLKSCGALSGYAKEHGCADDDEDMDLAARTAFCEVILLAAISHGVHIAFLVLGEDVPPLPSWEEARQAPGPVNIRFSSLVGRVRRNDRVAGAPYFVRKDVRRTSSEYSKIDAKVWRELGSLMNEELPWICAVFSPPDLVMFAQLFLQKYYLTLGEMLLDWNELDYTKHCAPATRFDIETVAKAVSDEHSCNF